MFTKAITYQKIRTKIFYLIMGQPLFYPFFIEHFKRQKSSKNFDIALYSYKEYIFKNSHIVYYKPTYKFAKNFIFNLISHKHLYLKKKFTYNLFFELNFFKSIINTLPYRPKLQQYNSTTTVYPITLKTLKKTINKFLNYCFFLPLLKFKILFNDLLKIKLKAQ